MWNEATRRFHKLTPTPVGVWSLTGTQPAFAELATESIDRVDWEGETNMMRAGNCVLLALLAAACGEAPDAPAQRAPETTPAVEHAGLVNLRWFGAYCQEDYQNDSLGKPWQNNQSSIYDLCNRFVNDLDDTDTKSFYFNAHGAKTFFEESGDVLSGGLDTVDLTFFAGHGGAYTASESMIACGTGVAGVYPMYENGSYACTPKMRLGDDGHGLSVLSTYACETHAGGFHSVKEPGNIPGNLWVDRWVNAFRGGLRMTSGSVQDTFSGSTYADVGKRYSDNLQAGQTFATAWANALNVGSANDPSLIAAGSSAADCTSRLDNMNYQNFTNYPRLRDAAVVQMCRRYWENI